MILVSLLRSRIRLLAAKYFIKRYNMKNIFIFVIGISILFFGCKKELQNIPSTTLKEEVISISLVKTDTPLFTIILENDITVDAYFDFIEGLVFQYDSLVSYPLNEYLIVHANAWLIDSFAQTDYYFQMKEGNFVYNQNQQIILNAMDTLFIPNEKVAQKIQQEIDSYVIDINIPEFNLRILENDTVIYSFPIRVGQVGERYMSMAKRKVKMKTRTGVGTIVKINRNPRWQNPVDGQEYKTTQRDDLQRTLVPRIPFLITEINGLRWGQLIHPTTNPKTLGKAYSNGCIGTKEGDAWRIYFHAPIGTKIIIRYDLEVEENGKQIKLKNIYDYDKK